MDKTKKITTNREGHSKITTNRKGPTLQEDMAILYVHVPNSGLMKYMTQTLIEMKKEICSFIIGYCSSSQLLMEKNRQKNSKDMEEITTNNNQKDLTFMEYLPNNRNVCIIFKSLWYICQSRPCLWPKSKPEHF